MKALGYPRRARHPIGAALLALAFAGCAARSPAARSGARFPFDLARHAAAAGEEWISDELELAIEKPPGDAWAVATDVVSPDGNAIPLLVAHTTTGTQIVVQVSEPVDTPERLTRMLRSRLREEEALELDETKRLKNDAGGDAYGFSFHAEDDADGRVAVIRAGDHIVLVVASWPKGVDRRVIEEVDGLVRSVRSTTPQSGQAGPAGASRPKKT